MEIHPSGFKTQKPWQTGLKTCFSERSQNANQNAESIAEGSPERRTKVPERRFRTQLRNHISVPEGLFCSKCETKTQKPMQRGLQNATRSLQNAIQNATTTQRPERCVPRTRDPETRVLRFRTCVTKPLRSLLTQNPPTSSERRAC